MDASTSLYILPDIVAYSGRGPYQQAESQERLVKIIHASLDAAGVRPDAVAAQNQGDARMLSVPVDGLDVSRVLAVFPRHFNDELRAYNRDVATHAILRVRLAFAMGPTAEGRIGRTGKTPITVTRLNNATPLREAMAARPEAHLGVIVENHLYTNYVEQEFHVDPGVDEYVEVRVSDSVKGFDQNAWMRLVGYLASAPTAEPGAAPELRQGPGPERRPGPESEAGDRKSVV